MKSKKLSLREMWKLYSSLRKGIGNKSQHLLIDEIFEIMDGIDKEDFLESILILYPKIELQKHNPIELATLFISGLKQTEFFVFSDLIKELSHGGTK